MTALVAVGQEQRLGGGVRLGGAAQDKVRLWWRLVEGWFGRLQSPEQHYSPSAALPTSPHTHSSHLEPRNGELGGEGTGGGEV